MYIILQSNAYTRIMFIYMLVFIFIIFQFSDNIFSMYIKLPLYLLI